MLDIYRIYEVFSTWLCNILESVYIEDNYFDSS